jgi:SAM-dependent methyltransferase
VDDPGRERLRTVFDRAAEDYQRTRPVCPPQLFDDLIDLAGLGAGDRVLEIGCGTGQATQSLAERGFEVVGIELGARLAELARNKLAHLPRVSIVCSSFEEWSSRSDDRFDAVVAFNSFHWLDPELRLARAASLLHPGGALAVVGSRYAEHDGADPLWLALQEDYEAIAGTPEPRIRADAVKDRSAEFAEGGHFGDVVIRRYQWEIPFSADDYIALLHTSSWHRLLDDDVRRRLFDRIHQRISTRADATITPTMAAVLYVARRAPVGALPR